MNENRYTRVIRMSEGMKIFMPNKQSCLRWEQKLNYLGVRVRIGRNCETDLWSIYIISVPGSFVDVDANI